MEKPETPTALAQATGISIPYASQLLSDDPARRRVPSRPLAIHIFRTTGWRTSPLDGLTDEQIATLETVDPWVSRPSTEERAA